MTEERRWNLPGADTDEVDPADEPRPEDDTEKDTNPLLREGPDAPDAADIENPDKQL